MLNSCLKTYTYGQDKACVPEETIEKALASLTQSKATIFSEIVCLDKMDRIGIPAYTCKINQDVAKALKFEETYGKGITPEQAKASALMELIERYSGFMYLKNTNHFIIAPYKEIKEKAIPLDSLLHPIPFYYRDNKILEILESIPLAWVKAYSFKQDKEVLFPLPWFYRIYWYYRLGRLVIL
ncbi:YcaO cyclodehydratase, ATP-ad Mg2+-binding [Candidatus Methanoperedenaceae archaeon GB37]|nr:YcaO cyclodehydratase, ATP-ad Mg2+-binding [Candidatus Methanoperedenaceae archaeon GB37]